MTPRLDEHEDGGVADRLAVPAACLALAGAAAASLVDAAPGWSQVTLIVAVPLGLASLTGGPGSRRRLLLAGVMAFLVLANLALTTSQPVTAITPVHVATYAAALAALVLALAGVEAEGAGRWRTAAAYAVVIAVALGLGWTSDLVGRLVAEDGAAFSLRALVAAGFAVPWFRAGAA